MPVRILVAEDDRLQANVIRRYLEREGHETSVVYDGRAVLEQVCRREPDLLVLDLTLPVMDGVDVCRTLRCEQGRDVPIIMLTARTSEDDLLLGLSVGADDYLTKPYRPRELVARVQTVLRRTARARHADVNRERHQVGGLLVDLARHEVVLDGTPVLTTPAEFTLLACLAAAPGRVFTREVLLERLGGFEREVTARSIDMHVMNLRRKLEPVPTKPRYLLTVYGAGYKLSDDAT